MNYSATITTQAPASEHAWSDTGGLLAAASIEATAGQVEATDDLARRLPPGAPVYLPYLPDMAFTDTLEACRKLVAAGLRPVPHLAARRIGGPAELDAALPRFVEAGVDTMLLIAGDRTEPAGAFADTLQVLDTGLLARHGIRRLGVAGHPQGHPDADWHALSEALARKVEYARATGTEMWLVTQFVFEAGPLFNWEQAMRSAGITLPVHVGIPGPAKIRTLVSYALKCGVDASARALMRNPGALKLLGSWSPDPLVEEIEAYRAAVPQTLLTGVHVFTFGGLARALDWLAAARAQEIP
jgi:methylenetetrahydrofolate reductase (NADPH)